MAKRKTLPKDFEQLVEVGNEQEIKNVFEKCDINAYGGYNKGNQRAGNVKENDSNGLWKINRAVPC